MPRIFAACVLFPPVLARASRMASRSISVRVREAGSGIGPSAVGGRTPCATSGGRSPGSIAFPCATRVAVSSALRSCRTLPGHRYASRLFNAAGESRAGGTPFSFPMTSRKWSHSFGMSSRPSPTRPPPPPPPARPPPPPPPPPPPLLLLGGARELRLAPRRHVPDLVEEERPP